MYTRAIQLHLENEFSTNDHTYRFLVKPKNNDLVNPDAFTRYIYLVQSNVGDTLFSHFFFFTMKISAIQILTTQSKYQQRHICYLGGLRAIREIRMKKKDCIFVSRYHGLPPQPVEIRNSLYINSNSVLTVSEVPRLDHRATKAVFLSSGLERTRILPHSPLFT